MYFAIVKKKSYNLNVMVSKKSTTCPTKTKASDSYINIKIKSYNVNQKISGQMLSVPKRLKYKDVNIF